MVGIDPKIPFNKKLAVPVRLKSSVVLWPWQIVGFTVFTEKVGYSLTVTDKAGLLIEPGQPVISDKLSIE